MKKALSYIIPILFLFSMFLGCYGSTKNVGEQETERVFSYNVDLKKDEIKKRVLQYVNEKFMSGKATTQTNEEGLLSGNGIVPIYVPGGLFGETRSEIKVEFTFIIKYEDNKYKIKWIVKDLLSNHGGSIPRTVWGEDNWGKYRVAVDNAIVTNNRELYEYLSKTKGDLDF